MVEQREWDIQSLNQSRITPTEQRLSTTDSGDDPSRSSTPLSYWPLTLVTTIKVSVRTTNHDRQPVSWMDRYTGLEGLLYRGSPVSLKNVPLGPEISVHRVLSLRLWHTEKDWITTFRCVTPDNQCHQCLMDLKFSPLTYSLHSFLNTCVEVLVVWMNL